MRAHGGGEDLLRLAGLSRAVEGLQQGRPPALSRRMLRKEGAQPPGLFRRLSGPAPGQRALHLRVEQKSIRLDPEERRRRRVLSPRPQRPLHRLERERTFVRAPALDQRQSPVERELGMIRVQAQRAFERELRVGAAVGAEQGDRDAQQGHGNVAPLVLALRPPAAHPHEDGRRLLPQAVRGDESIVVLVGGALRRLHPLAQPLRHRLGRRNVSRREQQPHQLAVSVGIVRLGLDGRLEMVAGLHGLVARDRNPAAEQMGWAVTRIERERGGELGVRIGDAGLLDQHVREHRMEVGGLRIVEKRLAQLLGRGDQVVRVLRQQGVQVMMVGPRADVALWFPRAARIPFRLYHRARRRRTMSAAQSEQEESSGAPENHPPRPAISASCTRPASGESFQTICPFASKSRSNNPRPVSCRIRAVASSRDSPLAFATWSTSICPMFFFASASAASEKCRSSLCCSIRARLRPAATSASPTAATTPPTTRPERSTNPCPLSTKNALSISNANAPPTMPTKAPPMVRSPLVLLAIPYWNETLGTARAPLSALKYSFGVN